MSCILDFITIGHFTLFGVCRLFNCLTPEIFPLAAEWFQVNCSVHSRDYAAERFNRVFPGLEAIAGAGVRRVGVTAIPALCRAIFGSTVTSIPVDQGKAGLTGCRLAADPGPEQGFQCFGVTAIPALYRAIFGSTVTSIPVGLGDVGLTGCFPAGGNRWGRGSACWRNSYSRFMSSNFRVNCNIHSR